MGSMAASVSETLGWLQSNQNSASETDWGPNELKETWEKNIINKLKFLK